MGKATALRYRTIKHPSDVITAEWLGTAPELDADEIAAATNDTRRKTDEAADALMVVF